MRRRWDQAAAVGPSMMDSYWLSLRASTDHEVTGSCIRFVPSRRSSAGEYLLANRCNVWRILDSAKVSGNRTGARACSEPSLAYDFTIQLSQSLFVQHCSAPKMATMSQIHQSVTKSMTRQRRLIPCSQSSGGMIYSLAHQYRGCEGSRGGVHAGY
jgi:hypothetical protein